jgi:hypothetical protein
MKGPAPKSAHVTKRRSRRLLLAITVLVAGSIAVVSLRTGSAPGSPPPLPTLSINDAAAVQYQAITTTMTFTVTLSAASTSPVTVDWATRPGDNKLLPPGQAAEENEDFAPGAGTLTFAPGETSKTIDVTLNGEQGVVFEADEYFSLDLSSPNGATLARGTGVGTIHFTAVPPPDHVNVQPLGGDQGQCVVKTGSLACVPLTGETQLPIAQVLLVDPGTGAINLRGTYEGAATFKGTPFGVQEQDTPTTGAAVVRPVIVVKLLGGHWAICHTRSKASAGRSLAVALKPKGTPVRRLFGRGHGHFRTRGRYSAGTVRGTTWSTIDYCNGTLIRVSRGIVDVFDFVLKRHIKVYAGHSYFASPSKNKK